MFGSSTTNPECFDSSVTQCQKNNSSLNLKQSFLMKKTTLSFIAFCIFFSSFFLTGCQKDDINIDNNNVVSYQTDIPSEKLTKDEALKEISPVVQLFLNSQYDYLISKDKTPKWNNYVTTGGDVLKTHLDNYREISYYNSYDKLISYKSEFIYDEKGYVSSDYPSSLVRSGDVWILKNVYDKFSMTETPEGKPAQETNTPPSQGGIWYREIIMKKTGNKWFIQSWKEDILGAPYRWYKEKIRINNEPQIEYRTTSYNRAAAVMYAINYVFNPNSNYPDYSNYGGDCTNFASQCLEAGGWTQISSGTNKWFHNKGYTTPPSSTYRSPSWTSASSLQAFLNRSSRVASSPASSRDLNIGDILQLTSSSSAYHTTIVSRRTVVNGITKIEVHYRNASGYPAQAYANITTLSLSSAKNWKIANSY
jgi:hypothetical protein